MTSPLPSLPDPPPQLRPLNILRDLPAVANLVEVCFASTLDEDGRRYLQQMRRSGADNAFLRWAAQVSDTVSMPLTGFVWEENGAIIGNASLIPFRHHHRKYYLIANVAVHPDQRRRGIGRHLTLAAMTHARRKNADETWLQVRSDNPGAIDLYASLGFHERARRTTWRRTLDRTAQAAANSPIPLTRRLRRDWERQKEGLNLFQPPQLDWYQPLPWTSLRPDLLYSLERFLLGDETRHWVARHGRDLVGALTWLPMPSSFPDRLLISLPPASASATDLPAPTAEQALLALLNRAVKELSSWRKTLSLDLPDDQFAATLAQAGFHAHRTLLWMQAQDDPDLRSG